MSNLNDNSRELISVEKERAKLYDSLEKIFISYDIAGQTLINENQKNQENSNENVSLKADDSIKLNKEKDIKKIKNNKFADLGFSKDEDQNNKLSFDLKNFYINNLVNNLVKKEPKKEDGLLSKIEDAASSFGNSLKNITPDFIKNMFPESSEAKPLETKTATEVKSTFDNTLKPVERIKLMNQTRELFQKTIIDILESIEKRQKSYSAKEEGFLNAGVLDVKSIKNLKDLIASEKFTTENLIIFADNLMNVSAMQEASLAAYANFDENNFAVMRNVDGLKETKESLLGNIGTVNNYLNTLGDEKGYSINTNDTNNKRFFKDSIVDNDNFSTNLKNAFEASLGNKDQNKISEINSEIDKLNQSKYQFEGSKVTAKLNKRTSEQEINLEIKTIETKIKKLEEQKSSYQKLYDSSPKNFEEFKERSIKIEETINGAFHLKKANFPKINLGIFDYLKQGQIGKAFKSLGNALVNPIGQSSEEYKTNMSEEKAYNLSIDNFKKLIKEFTVYSTEIDKMNENLAKNSGLASDMSSVSKALNNKFEASRKNSIAKIIVINEQYKKIVDLEKTVKDLEKKLKDEKKGVAGNKKEEEKVDENAKNTNTPVTASASAPQAPAPEKSALEKKLETAKKNLKDAQMEFANFSKKSLNPQEKMLEEINREFDDLNKKENRDKNENIKLDVLRHTRPGKPDDLMQTFDSQIQKYEENIKKINGNDKYDATKKEADISENQVLVDELKLRKETLKKNLNEYESKSKEKSPSPEDLLKTMKEETKAIKDVNKTFDKGMNAIVKVFAALFESIKNLFSKKDIGEQELKSNLKLDKAELYDANLQKPTK